jgi:glutamate 5-kinase
VLSFLRDEILKTCDVIVVKVGTNVLTLPNGLLNTERIAVLTDALSKMIHCGKRVILVSSGAVGAGMGQLGLKKRPLELAQVQAVAALGQAKLIERYEDALSKYNVHPAQILLTADELSERKRYLNARNTIHALLDYKALPIINENDTVSVENLHTTFGDNDRLAGLVANLFENPLLILLTDVDGLFDRDPSDPKATLISCVDHWSPDLMKMVAEKHSSRSKGGMTSKLNAAKMITQSGGNVIIANGNTPETLLDIFASKEVGTLFITENNHLSARQRWLSFAVRTEGKIVLDDGAINAVCKRGSSLLPIGVLDADGDFERGGIVSLTDRGGREIARGLTNYGLRDVLLLRGKNTHEIKRILGFVVHEDVVHRDNLIVVNGE